jgi:hypothetical protein
MPQTPGRRGARRAVSAQHKKTTVSEAFNSPPSGRGSREMMSPQTHGRRRTRSIGATQSTAAEELASVLGEYASFTPPPRMVLSGL